LQLLTCVSYVAGGLMVSFVCNALLLRFSKSLGIRNTNDIVIRWSNQSKPSLGGISFFTVFIFSAIAIAVNLNDVNIFGNLAYVGLIISAILAFLMGLADDAYNTRPMAKFGVQIICGIVLIATGTKLDITHVYWIDAAFTIIWVVGIMNSLNMLDNMDGITGVTVLFITITCLFSCGMLNHWSIDIWSLTMLGMIGAIIGFLCFNIHPSKIFMGDAGSQFIGLFVAFISIKFLLNVGSITQTPSWTSMLLTLIAFTPAAVDTFTVIINRLKAGKSPMVGGKDHTTHYLVYAGYNDRQVWYVFTAISVLSCLLSCFMIHLILHGKTFEIVLCLPFFVFTFLLLYRNTIKFKAKEN
jgi:UDP-GlcNAc:undecaprenyl-phosphate GlcNAc-1-phosphate transferase